MAKDKPTPKRSDAVLRQKQWGIGLREWFDDRLITRDKTIKSKQIEDAAQPRGVDRVPEHTAESHGGVLYGHSDDNYQQRRARAVAAARGTGRKPTELMRRGLNQPYVNPKRAARKAEQRKARLASRTRTR